MNRAFLLALAACLFTVTAFAAAPARAAGKIGVANLAWVMTQSQPGQEAQKQIENQFGKENKDLEAQFAALDKKAEDLNKQAAALSEKARADKAMEIQTQYRDFEAKRGDFSQRVANVRQAISAQIEEIVTKACNSYGSQNGFDVIIDRAAVMYTADAVDVTDGLMEEVDKEWKARGGKFTNLGGKAPAKK